MIHQSSELRQARSFWFLKAAYDVTIGVIVGRSLEMKELSAASRALKHCIGDVARQNMPQVSKKDFIVVIAFSDLALAA
jgi:hypothetical protein